MSNPNSPKPNSPNPSTPSSPGPNVYSTSNEQGPLPTGWTTRFSKTKPGKRLYIHTTWKRPQTEMMSDKPATAVMNKEFITQGGPQSLPKIEVVLPPTPKTYTAQYAPAPNTKINWDELKEKCLHSENGVTEFKEKIISELKAGRDISLDVVEKFLNVKDTIAPKPGSKPVLPWTLPGVTPYRVKISTNKNAKWTKQLEEAYTARQWDWGKEERIRREKQCLQELKRGLGLDDYTLAKKNFPIMKNAIIARIKAGETIPLKPDIEKLYYLKPDRAPGGCSYPGAGESCWTSKFQELYDELKKEAVPGVSDPRNTYESLKSKIINRLKKGEEIPLHPDIEKLYNEGEGLEEGHCSTPNMTNENIKSCEENRLESFYKKLKDEALPGVSAPNNKINWKKLREECLQSYDIDNCVTEFKKKIISELKAGRDISLDVVQQFLNIKDATEMLHNPPGAAPTGAASHTLWPRAPGGAPGGAPGRAPGGASGGRRTKKHRGGAIPPPWILDHSPYMSGVSTNKNAKWTEQLKQAYYDKKIEQEKEYRIKRQKQCYQELRQAAGLEASTVAEEPATVKMAVTPNTSVGSSCASRHFNTEEDRKACYNRQKGGKKKTRKISKNHRKHKTSKRRH